MTAQFDKLWKFLLAANTDTWNELGSDTMNALFKMRDGLSDQLTQMGYTFDNETAKWVKTGADAGAGMVQAFVRGMTEKYQGQLTPFLYDVAHAIAVWGDGIVNDMTDTFKQALAISGAIAAQGNKDAAAQPILGGASPLTGGSSGSGNSGSSGSSGGGDTRPPVPGPDATREEKDAYINWMNTHQMAKGGIVRARAGGTFALLGEAGHDEAVIPLSSGGARGLGGVVNLYVQGSILSERDIIRIIRNELLNGGMSDIFGGNFGLSAGRA